MIEITKEEAILLRDIDNSIHISQTMKTKRRRGKYFLEESSKNLLLLEKIKPILLGGKEKLSLKKASLINE